jgi:GMP synthase (glutamine-hydrolysing)
MKASGKRKMKRESILVLDFGGQYTQLIARRIRELNVYSEIVPHTITVEEIRRHHARGLVYSGGPTSVYEKDSYHSSPELLKAGVPILGICYGLQLITHQLGGQVASAERKEFGPATIQLGNDPLFKDLGTSLNVWMSHGDRILGTPPGFHSIATSHNSPVAAIVNDDRTIYALQFHPEVAHTQKGTEILRNFVFEVCHCEPSWTPASFIEETVATVREKVKKGKILCALSGGVDSTVMAFLLKRGAGTSLVPVFIDNGLLRLHEGHQVTERLRKHGLDVRYFDASDYFLTKLEGVENPEEKRKIIGRAFVEVFERIASETEGLHYLAQGTLYPDVIESGGWRGTAQVIKTHHNLVDMIKTMRLELLEPFREIFKDEVRKIGMELGLPDEIIHRQPFPGPGLAVRCLGPITRERLELLRKADAIIKEEIVKAGWYRQLWQSFGILLPVRAVGVMGDVRTYGNVVALRAVHSQDGMTADWARLPYDVLATISSRIVNEIPGINHVVYDITSKPPGTIEWE